MLRLAVAVRLDAELAVWLALRDMDAQGLGWHLAGPTLLAVLSDRYGLGAQQTLYRNLQTGDGLFWTRHGGRIFLHGLGRVTRVLLEIAERTSPDLITAAQATCAVAGHPVALPYPFYTPTRAGRRTSTRREIFFAAWLGAQRGGTRVITVVKLSRIWGVSPDTIRRWKDWPGITVERTWCEAPLWAAPMAPAHAQEIETAIGPRLMWRGPDRLTASLSRLPSRGLAGKLSRNEIERGRPALAYAEGHVDTPVRLFWEQAKPAIRDKRRPPESVYFTLTSGPQPAPEKRPWRGTWWLWRCDLPRLVIEAEWALRRSVWADLRLTHA